MADRGTGEDRATGRQRPRTVIIGGGFAGLACARDLGRTGLCDVVLIDRQNHHVFQPLLYQVAMAGLSPAEIARPIRSLLSELPVVRVLQGEVSGFDLESRQVQGDFGQMGFDHLVVATGVRNSYFGQDHWAAHAPGLKTLADATEIRRRVLTAFERAERESEPLSRKAHLTFVIVGGGPTGVELAGAVGEMSRFCLARDFRVIDPKLTRVILIEAGSRILSMFDDSMSARAMRDLEMLGVQVWTDSLVTDIDEEGVSVGDERISAQTVLWAAGIRASPLADALGMKQDRVGRVRVFPDLSLPEYPNVFVAGDLAHFDAGGAPLPGVAPVALQEGKHVAQVIVAQITGRDRPAFVYRDKGQMATIGRSKAIVQSGRLRLTGFTAWLAWLVIHIYYLSGFKNRLFVLLQWAWSYVTFGRGARLIVNHRTTGGGDGSDSLIDRPRDTGSTD